MSSSSPTPSISTSEKTKEQQEQDYSEDFEIENQSLQQDLENVVNLNPVVNTTAPFSFVGDDEEEEDVNVDSSNVQLQLSIMSTIDEERSNSMSMSIDQSSSDNKDKAKNDGHHDRIPDELKDLQHHFEGQGQDSDDSDEKSSQNESKSVNNNQTQNDDDDDDEDPDSGLEAILNRLKMLENTQNLLENVLDSNNPSAGEVENVIQSALQQLSEATKLSKKSNKKQKDCDEEEESEMDISLKQEMDSLKRLLDITVEEEEQGEEMKVEQRQISQVLEEYDALERSLSFHSRTGSCDEQESLINDALIMKNKVPPPPPQYPWMETQTKQQQQTFYQQENLQNPTTKLQLFADNNTKDKDESTLLDLNQFIDMEEERSRTKTIQKKKIPPTSPSPSPSTPTKKSFSATNFSPTPPSPSSRAGAPYLASKKPPLPGIKGSQSAGAGLNNNKGPISQKSTPRRSSLVVEEEKAGGDQDGSNNKRNENNLQRQLYKLEAELENQKEIVSRLNGELSKQESLLVAYQEDNQKLYGALKSKESIYAAKEAEWEELISSLKTEIATLKIARFTGSPSSRPSTPNVTHVQLKSDLARFKEESCYKSEQITELRKEIIGLRNDLGEAQQKVKTTPKNAKLLLQEREKEWQKSKSALTKQVRTLQKILYSKDPAAATATATGINLTTCSNPGIYSSQEILPDLSSSSQTGQISLLENRIQDLEKNLAQADTDGKERLKDFQSRLNSLKSKYDQQLTETELQLEETRSKLKLVENSSSSSTLSELQTKLDRSFLEISHLKQELSRSKRELEIAAKSSLPPQNAVGTAKADAGTLSLAIKSFKVELAEKEKELVKLKRENGDLQRTNTTLKREREKYLGTSGGGLNSLSYPSSSTIQGVHPRIVNRITQNVGNVRGQDYKGSSSSLKNMNTRLGGSPTKTAQAPSSTVEILQNTLDYERTEFESLLNNKKKEIEDKDKMIQKLRKQLQSGGNINDANATVNDEHESLLKKKDALLQELHSRLTSQNEIILRLKEHLSHFRDVEEQISSLLREKESSSRTIEQLNQKLQLAQALSRPENEILAVLAQKFDELNSRYLQREAQMEQLLYKLSVRTGTSSAGSAFASFSGQNIAKPQNKQGHSSIIEQLLNLGTSSSSVPVGELDLRQLSPSLYEHLFTTIGIGNKDSTEV